MTGREIARIRSKLGLTQPEFGLIAGLSSENRRRTVSRWETGETKVPPHRVLLIQAHVSGWRPK